MKLVAVLQMALFCIGNGSILAQPSGAFTSTGSMLTPRFRHTATLLPDGKVLIAGGDVSCILGSACIPATNAELYDPAKGIFTAAGTMNTIRPVGGILLNNGKVFFADGYPTGGKPRIELYDPFSGEFKIAGASVSLGVIWSAALLNDGTVFMTGINGAEIYDPVAERSVPVTTWPAGVGYTAVLAVLPDNRVLLDVPAIFDPVTGIFTKQVSWEFNDTPPASLLADGKVLVTGGNNDAGNVNWAELFDPSDGSIRRTGSMSYTRDGHTSNLLPDGTVLIAGGLSMYNSATNSDLVTASAEIYEPTAGGFTSTTSMTTPRYAHAAVLLNSGQVLITGGMPISPVEGLGHSFVGTASAAAEVYTPGTLIPAPALFHVSGDGQTQGAIWHSLSGQIASPDNPAAEGEILSLYTTSLMSDALIPPRIIIGGKLGDTLFFGRAPGYPGYFQVNFRVPNGVVGQTVPVRLAYLGRWSNEVTIGMR